LLGLGTGALAYVVLSRHGVRRWLATAVAGVLDRKLPRRSARRRGCGGQLAQRPGHPLLDAEQRAEAASVARAAVTGGKSWCDQRNGKAENGCKGEQRFKREAHGSPP